MPDGERDRCPTCGHQFEKDDIKDQMKCPNCNYETSKDSLITEDDDYAWCQ